MIVFNMSVSLDGRTSSPDGSLEWVAVDEEIHQLFNDEASAMAAFLMGRRTYELLQAFWPSADADPGATPAIVDFAAIWRSKRKFVFSRTLGEVDATASLVRDVTRETVERIKLEAPGDLSVGGPSLAASFMRLGLIDQLVMYVNPVVVGGGPPYLPPLEQPLTLTCTDARPLSSGVVRLEYSR